MAVRVCNDLMNESCLVRVPSVIPVEENTSVKPFPSGNFFWLASFSVRIGQDQRSVDHMIHTQLGLIPKVPKFL